MMRCGDRHDIQGLCDEIDCGEPDQAWDQAQAVLVGLVRTVAVHGPRAASRTAWAIAIEAVSVDLDGGLRNPI